MDFRNLFIDTIRRSEILPKELCEHAQDATAVEMHHFDSSYIEFLDEQIRLSPLGPKSMEILKRRRAAFKKYCDIPLLRGNIRVGDTGYTLEIHPETGAIVHWEQYEYDPAG
jgi:hypothetical protein